MSKRTWMRVKISADSPPLWVGIENDTIVAVQFEGTNLGIVIGLRADDTLSGWAHRGGSVEGPFDEPV